jgi:integrase
MTSLATPYKHPQSGIYYLRIGVPKALRSSVNKTVIKQSLHTRDFSVAKQRFAVAYAEAMSALISPHSQVISPQDIQDITHEWFVKQASEMELHEGIPSAINDLKNDIKVSLSELRYRLQSGLEAGYEYRVIHAGKVAVGLTEELSLSIVTGSEIHRLLIDKLCWRLLDLCSLALNKEGWTEVAIYPITNHIVANTIHGDSTKKVKLLGRVIKDYIRHKQVQAEWQSTTEKDARNIYDLMLDELGADTDPNSLSREQFRGFLELLSKLPSYYTNNKRYEKYTLAKVISIADTEGLPRISPSTVRKKFSFVKALVRFAVEEEWMNKDRTKGVQIKTEGTEAVRKPYTKEEIKIIMDATRHKTRASDYWMPRIGLTTGMRANEILQLLVKDVRCHEGIWYFDINKDIDPATGLKKKLKTTNSIRKIPIPNSLIEIGFLDFVVKVSEGRLFPCVTCSHDGRYSYIYSKRFNWMITKLGLKPDASVNQLKDFHSFRHTFRASCREYAVSNEQANLIGGWKSSLDSTAGDRYGKDFVAFIRKLKESIDLVKYIDLN